MIDEKKLAEELEEMGEGGIALLEASADKTQETGLAAIKHLTSKGQAAIILSASRPHANLMALYKKSGIDAQKIIVIDCVSKSQTPNPPKADNAAYLDNLSDLTAMSISLQKFLDSTKGKKFVYIDSITTLLVYNNAKDLARFVHYILTKLRIIGAGGILVAIEGETDKEVRAEIAQLCDKVIKA